MKIYLNDEYVKLVPKKYDPIREHILNLVGTEKKLLNVNERERLESAYNKKMFEDLLENIKLGAGLAVYSIVKNAKLEAVLSVSRRSGEQEHRINLVGAPQMRVSETNALHLCRYGNMELISVKLW